jgi:hypothetical protein
MVPMYKKGGKKSSKKKSSFMEESKEITFGNKPMKKGYGGMKYKAGGFPDLTGDGKVTKADVLKGRGVDMKKSGGKSMEPGGGGRFAAMVSKLKGKGKSEDSAKAIAASIGRKKYGKSKFQEMAAAGKKGLGGMSDSTSANDAGMEMMEAMGPKKPKKGSSGTRDTGPNVKRTKKARKNIGKCNRGEICFD